ncbi:hypothetical protein FF1_022118 [Malus domestica]
MNPSPPQPKVQSNPISLDQSARTMTRCRFKFHSGTHVSLRTCRLYVLPSTSTAKSPPIFAEHHFTRCFCVLCCASRDFEEPIFG